MNWFTGSTFSIWWKFLKENRSIVTRKNWFRIICISTLALCNSRIAKKDKKLLKNKNINAIDIKDPIFILGHWRSGTSYLQNILVNDRNFNYPTLLQVTFPDTFLTIQDRMNSKRHYQSIIRPMDNVQISTKSPGEEEVAIWTMSSISSIGNRLLQDKEKYFDKFLTFENASKEDYLGWESNFIYFLRKISINDKRQLLLKSPEHTARIKLLLDIFPEAKFINIRRNPIDVFQSTKHLYNKVIKPSYFHEVSEDHLVDRIIQIYKTMYDSYFREVLLIPKGNFIDISYEDLIAQPGLIIEKIYRELGLELSKTTEERIGSYLRSMKDYEKNEYGDLDPSLRKRIYSEWHLNFRNWNYL